MEKAKREMECINQYHYCVLNDDQERAAKEIEKIIYDEINR